MQRSQLMISSEWPAMNHGEKSKRAYQTVGELIKVMQTFQPSSLSQSNLQQQGFGLIRSFLDARRLRLVTNKEGIPPMLLTILLIGATLMIGTTFFAYQTNRFRQLCLTAILATVVGLLLSLFIEFAYPYRGNLKVTTTGWESLLQELKNE